MASAESAEKRFVGCYVDAPTVQALQEIARKEFDGNVSMTMRRITREAAERRGVLVESKAGDRPEGANV